MIDRIRRHCAVCGVDTLSVSLMCMCLVLAAEDTANYTCTVKGRKSVVLDKVVHSLHVIGIV